MKKDKLKRQKKRYGFELTGNFYLYLAVFLAALIFTQALRSTASSIFFGFVFALPIIMLIYTLIAKSALKVYMVSDSATIEKNAPYTYEFRILNETIFPFPFIDGYIDLPQKNSVRCAERLVKLSMAPLSAYNVKNTITFRFRGTYEIGVKCFYVYDFFRMFRIRVYYDVYNTVYVLPRKLNIDFGEAHAISDSADRAKKSPYSYDKIEISDIRDYRMGDSLKSIHWKLSSKSEDFIVRDYDTGVAKSTIVYCDMSARFPYEPPKETASEKRKKKNAKKAKLTKAEKAAEKERKKEEKLAAQTAQKKSVYIDDDDPDVKQVTEADIKKQMADKQIAAEAKKKIKGRNKRKKADKDTKAKKDKNSLSLDISGIEEREEVDVHRLSDPLFYEDMNEYCADGVVELTVAAVLRELRAGNECALLWFDSRSEGGAYAFSLRGLEDFATVYKLFSTAPLCPEEDNVARLSAMMSETQNTKQIFVTSAIDMAAVTDFCAIPCGGDSNSFGSSEVILYNPEERFEYPKERHEYIEGCRKQLSDNGLKLIEGVLENATVIKN